MNSKPCLCVSVVKSSFRQKILLKVNSVGLILRGMREWLEAERGAKYVGVAGLAEAAARILAESGAAPQGRGTVTELPDERTVRYYLAEGLVPPAEEKQGTASVFGYRHL